jgi:hypothetical protein
MRNANPINRPEFQKLVSTEQILEYARKERAKWAGAAMACGDHERAVRYAEGKRDAAEDLIALLEAGKT